MKFNLSHFPAGTVFEIKDEVFHQKDKDGNPINTYTAVEITEPHPGHYIIHCAESNEYYGKPALYWMNHVKRIVSRGDGQIIFNGCVKNTMPFPRRFPLDDYTRDVHAHFVKIAPARGVKVPSRKTHYAFSHTLDTSMQMRLLLSDVGHANLVYDNHAMHAALIAQPFVKAITLGGQVVRIYMAPKKRMKAWIRRNRNRFLVKFAVAREQRIEQGYHDVRDFNAEDDEDATATLNAALQNPAQAREIEEETGVKIAVAGAGIGAFNPLKMPVVPALAPVRYVEKPRTAQEDEYFRAQPFRAIGEVEMRPSTFLTGEAAEDWQAEMQDFSRRFVGNELDDLKDAKPVEGEYTYGREINVHVTDSPVVGEDGVLLSKELGDKIRAVIDKNTDAATHARLVQEISVSGLSPSELLARIAVENEPKEEADE